MNRWVELKEVTPRKGELIMVKSQSGIYPHLLYVEGPRDWWVWDEGARAFFDRNGECSGTKLSFHGITHWTLLESPY